MRGIIIVLALMLIAVPVLAGEGVPNIDDKEGIELGVKVDAPDLIKINKDVSIGVEVEKDCVQTNMKEGWSAVAKVTVKWSLLDFSK